MPDVLLRRWNDWSAGIGHLVDDGRTPGMYYAVGLLGLRGELRPAPLVNTAAGIKYVGVSCMPAVEAAGAYCAACLQPSSGSTLTYDAKSSGQATDTGVTFAHTVTAAGSDRVLVVCVSSEGVAAPTGVTYAGDALTKHGESFSTLSDDTAVSIWYKVNPATGANNVVVSGLGAGTDVVAGATSWTGAHQTTPLLAFVGMKDSSYLRLCVVAADGGATIDCVALSTGSAITFHGSQTERWDLAQDTTRGACSTGEVLSSGMLLQPNSQLQWFLEESATTDSAVNFLYALSGAADGGEPVVIYKVSINNADFADIQAPVSGTPCTDLANLLHPTYAGQPAKYQGKWYIPAGGLHYPFRLTSIGTGDSSTDDGTGGNSATVLGADHLTMLGHQLVSVLAGAGVSILKSDGDPYAEGDWGDFFPVGDKEERATALKGLEGATFVMKREGLFSFNSKGRSRLVFEDFRSWSNTLASTPISAYKTGLFLPHPSALLWYRPGDIPVDVGFDAEAAIMPASGVTELHGGRHHSTAVVGEFVYSIYQPDLSSTSCLVLCGRSKTRGGDPLDLVWNAVASVTLENADNMLGCFVTTKSRPLSASYVTPTLWFGDSTNLKYVVLDGKASPFRSRADTHKVCTSAEAYMSDLRFTEPMDLTRIVVRTSTDMVAGDEFQISLIADGTGKEENVGVPVKGGGARHALPLGRHNMTSLVLHVKWTATDATDRVPPVIHAIELYGRPAQGQQSRGEE